MRKRAELEFLNYLCRERTLIDSLGCGEIDRGIIQGSKFSAELGSFDIFSGYFPRLR